MGITAKLKPLQHFSIGIFNFPAYHELANPFFALNHLEIVLGTSIPVCVWESLPLEWRFETKGPNNDIVYLNTQAVYVILMSVNMDKRCLDHLRLRWGLFMADIKTEHTLHCILTDGGV